MANEVKSPDKNLRRAEMELEQLFNIDRLLRIIESAFQRSEYRNQKRSPIGFSRGAVEGTKVVPYIVLGLYQF